MFNLGKIIMLLLVLPFGLFHIFSCPKDLKLNALVNSLVETVPVDSLNNNLRLDFRFVQILDLPACALGKNPPNIYLKQNLKSGLVFFISVLFFFNPVFQYCTCSI